MGERSKVYMTDLRCRPGVSLLNKLDTGELQASLFQILHYRYYNYDLDQPFMPQYQKNMAALVRFLQQRLGEV